MAAPSWRLFYFDLIFFQNSCETWYIYILVLSILLNRFYFLLNAFTPGKGPI